ncbi:MAG TPA: hypothetical protein VGB98_23120 [Pyrinomonadaceae bacterium]
MSIEAMTPRPGEIPGSAAQAILGFTTLAAVRKLLGLGHIKGRKIGSDLWYDRESVETYAETRNPRGRRPIEGGGDDLTAYNRLAKRVNREGGSLRDVKKKPRPWAKKAAKSKKGAARKGGRAAKGGSASKAGRSSKKSARSAGKKK